MESQKTFTKKFSFEFFPPKTPEAVGKLQTTQGQLARLKPDFFSVTFGAGGSTRERTLETVIDIYQKTGIEGVPHVSCIGSTIEEIKSILNSYIEEGIHKVVALRGDLPSGAIGTGSLRYGSELVEFIRRETGDHFYIEVAILKSRPIPSFIHSLQVRIKILIISNARLMRGQMLLLHSIFITRMPIIGLSIVAKR